MHRWFYIFSIFVAAGCESSDDTKDARDAVRDTFLGTWRTPCALQPDGSYGLAEFFVGPAERGSFTYSIYGDAACSVNLGSVTIEDEQYIGDPVPAVGDNVWELDLPYLGLTAIANTEEFATVMESAGCGSGPLPVGVSFDVSETGCFFFRPIAECPGDYDIFTIDGDEYRNGVRLTDMCTPAGRPTALNTDAFFRVE